MIKKGSRVIHANGSTGKVRAVGPTSILVPAGSDRVHMYDVFEIYNGETYVEFDNGTAQAVSTSALRLCDE